MKKSFYDMLGVKPDADQAQLDAGCATALARLNAVDLRGLKEATVEARMLREGLQMLSDPEQRAQYDAKLADLAAVYGAKVTYVTDESTGSSWVGVGLLIILVLSIGLAGMFIYPMLEVKVAEVRVEQAQAAARYRKEKDKDSVTIKPTFIMEENGMVTEFDPKAPKKENR